MSLFVIKVREFVEKAVCRPPPGVESQLDAPLASCSLQWTTYGLAAFDPSAHLHTTVDNVAIFL